MHLTYFITSHGFGHTTRAVEVINQLPVSVDIEIQTAAPDWLLKKSIDRPFAHVSLSHDCGIIQPDSFSQDIPATIQQWEAMLDAYPAMAKREAARLRELGTRLVVSDISPFGVAVATELGVPSIVIANFSWDWIFSIFPERFPEFVPIIKRIQEWYAQTDLLLQTPLSGEMVVFPQRKRIPLIVRQARQSREETRRALGIDSEQKVALVSFGGFGFARLASTVFERYPDWLFLTLQQSMLGSPNVRLIDSQECYHPDLVNAVDLAIAKLGYGAVTECIAHKTPIAHPPRADFPEHEILATEPKPLIPMMAVEDEPFMNGRWDFLQDDSWWSGFQGQETDLSGGTVAAEIIMERLQNACNP